MTDGNEGAPHAPPKQVLDRITDGVVALDSNLRYTYVNRRAELILGTSSNDLLGKYAWKNAPELTEIIAEQQVEEALSARRRRILDTYHPNLERWFEVHVHPDDTGVTLYFNDVTARKQEETSLRSMYRIAADRAVSLNQKLDRLLALGRDYLDLSYGFLTRISEDVQEIIQASGSHPTIQNGATCSLSEAYCRKTIRQDDLLAVQNAPNEGWAEDPAYNKYELGSYIGAKVIVEGDLYGTFCFADAEPRTHPFTERERSIVELMTLWTGYELEQRHTQSRLKRKNEWLDEFASVLSHDLRNPLNVALGQTAIAQDKLNGGEEKQRPLRKMKQALARMETIIRDTLILSQRGETDLELEAINISNLAEQCWEMVPSEDASLEIEDAFTLHGDADQLRHVFENLFRNAVEHSDGPVTIRVGQIDDQAFYVEDDGPGIPADERDSVFEPGYSSADDGSGLGLSIIRRIANAHDWRVAVADSPDGGARFVFSRVEIVSS